MVAQKGLVGNRYSTPTKITVANFMKTPTKVHKIAWQVRVICEETWHAHDLEGMCAIASASLFNALKKHKFNPKFVLGTYKLLDHCWVELNDSIVDITASQFGLDNITIIKKPSMEYLANHVSTTNKQILQSLRSWPIEQKPYQAVVKKILKKREKIVDSSDVL